MVYLQTLYSFFRIRYASFSSGCDFWVSSLSVSSVNAAGGLKNVFESCNVSNGCLFYSWEPGSDGLVDLRISGSIIWLELDTVEPSVDRSRDLRMDWRRLLGRCIF